MVSPMRRNAVLGGALLVLAVITPGASAQNAFGAACTKDDDCQSSICNTYFTDTTFTMNSLQAMMGFKEPDMGNAPGTSVKKGICVECRTECDCDVNQYCGASTELVIPVGVQSSNTGSGLTDYAREIMAAYGQAFSGMKLRGKCTSLPKVADAWRTWPVPKVPKFEIPDSVNGNKCINPAALSPFFQLEHEEIVDEVMHTNAKFDLANHGLTYPPKDTAVPATAYDVENVGAVRAVSVKSVRKPRAFPTSSKGTLHGRTDTQFCGIINQFAPAFYETVGSFRSVDNTVRPVNSEYLSTGNYFNTPAACPKWVNGTKSPRTTCNRCYDCDSARDPCAWSKADYKVYPEGWGELRSTDPKKNRDSSEQWRVVSTGPGSQNAAAGTQTDRTGGPGVIGDSKNGMPGAVGTEGGATAPGTASISVGTASSAATDGINGLEWEEDFQRGRGLDYQPWGSFYLVTDGLINEDGTTTSAMNGLDKDVFLGGANQIKQSNYNQRTANARMEGVTRDMCEECSVLCNRYTMRDEADFGIFQYDNMLDFDPDTINNGRGEGNKVVDEITNNGFNPYAYAKYPFAQDSPFEQYSEDCFLNPYAAGKDGNPATETFEIQECPTKAKTASADLKSMHPTQLGVKVDISKIKNRELFTGKHASSYMRGSKVAQAKWTRHSDHKLCMMKCYKDQRYDAWNGGQPWSNDPRKSEKVDTYNLTGVDAPKKMFDMCADKIVDIVVGPGGYQTNKQFYPMKVNSTYDVREYGIAMMEEREGAPLGCNDGVSTSNSFQTYVHQVDGSKQIASTDAIFNVGGFYFHSPIVEWQGHCEMGECRICKEDSTRCSGQQGVAQTCHQGIWVRSDDLKPYHDENYKYDPATKLLGAICIFLIMIILLFMLAIIIYCCCNRQEYIPVQKPMLMEMTPPPPITFMAPAPPQMMQEQPHYVPMMTPVPMSYAPPMIEDGYGYQPGLHYEQSSVPMQPYRG